ncbi:ScbR family autoregulator-binding transcription factor [Streptomyces cinnamoneus]|uniref:Gamma-butyrolactone-binding protein n=1 Tax=Streptomyces cinnamoneus TaxID=53446 RepID=A0A918TCV2_STRCJ|nr:ScbR family autoregulator-binding transcription factor [Streptomyces cinnamoneus]GHC37366.1 gamma-butyrolactone-binding protein [Streptomyces cinnamoneus]
MAQQERGIRTRRAALEAAAALFAERGYEACTISEILARAGVTKGALYFHFDSKESLARGVLEEQVSLEGVAPQASKLQEWVDVGMALAHRLPQEPLLRAGARLATDPHMQKLVSTGPWATWSEVSADLLSEAKARGEVLPHVEPSATARFVISAWTGVLLVSQVTTALEDLEEQISVLFRHILPALATPAILVQLDTSPDRGARVVAEGRRLAEATAVAAG